MSKNYYRFFIEVTKQKVCRNNSDLGVLFQESLPGLIQKPGKFWNWGIKPQYSVTILGSGNFYFTSSDICLKMIEQMGSSEGVCFLPPFPFVRWVTSYPPQFGKLEKNCVHVLFLLSNSKKHWFSKNKSVKLNHFFEEGDSYGGNLLLVPFPR